MIIRLSSLKEIKHKVAWLHGLLKESCTVDIHYPAEYSFSDSTAKWTSTKKMPPGDIFLPISSLNDLNMLFNSLCNGGTIFKL